MWIGIGILVFLILVGLCAAYYNLTNEEGRKFRLEARRAERASRKKPLWYLIQEEKNRNERKSNKPSS